MLQTSKESLMDEIFLLKNLIDSLVWIYALRPLKQHMCKALIEVFLKGQWQQVADCGKTSFYFICSNKNNNKNGNIRKPKFIIFKSLLTDVTEKEVRRIWCLDWVGVDVFFFFFFWTTWRLILLRGKNIHLIPFFFFYPNSNWYQFSIDKNFFSLQVKKGKFQVVILTLLCLLSKLVAILVLNCFFASGPCGSSLEVWMQTQGSDIAEVEKVCVEQKWSGAAAYWYRVRGPFLFIFYCFVANKPTEGDELPFLFSASQWAQFVCFFSSC